MRAVSEDRTIERALAGDQQAYAALFNETAPKLSRRLKRWFPEPDQREEVVHLTFIEAFRLLPRFERGRSFEAWVTGISDKCGRNYLRAARLRDVAWPVETEDATLSEARIDARTELSQLMHGLQHLPVLQRLAFTLAQVNGLGVSRIGEVMGSSPQAAWARVQAARSQLEANEVRQPQRSVPPLVDASHHPVLHVMWPTAATVEQIRAHSDEMDAYLRQDCPAAVVVEIPQLEFPSPSVLLAVADAMRKGIPRAGDRLRGVAYVFGSPLARGAVNLAWTLSRTRLVFSAHASFAPALAWAHARIAEVSPRF